MATEEPTLHKVVLRLCSACLDGEGEQCHTPGCALIYSRCPDLSIRDSCDVETIDGAPFDHATLKRGAVPAEPPTLATLNRLARRLPMADVVVTRADRRASLEALGMTMPDAWLDTGEIHRGPWGIADTLTQEECVANDVSAAIAAARAAERERCEGMVREMADAYLDTCDRNMRPVGKLVVDDLRDLAERIGKGE